MLEKVTPTRRRARMTVAPAVALMVVLSCAQAPALTAKAHAAQAFTVYQPTVAPTDFTFSPGAGASSGHSVVLWSTGSASAYLTTTDTVNQLSFRAEAQQCDGAPHLQVAVDGVTTSTREVDGVGSYVDTLDWPAGRHKVTFRFLDDHRTATCDRNVLVRSIRFHGPGEDGLPVRLGVGSSLKIQYVDVEPATAGNATDRRAKLWSNGSLRFRLDSQAYTEGYFGLELRGCSGAGADHYALVLMTVDGLPIYRSGLGYGYYYTTFGYDLADGPHQFVLTMTGDVNTATCDGNVAIVSAGIWGVVNETPDG